MLPIFTVFLCCKGFLAAYTVTRMLNDVSESNKKKIKNIELFNSKWGNICSKITVFTLFQHSKYGTVIYSNYEVKILWRNHYFTQIISPFELSNPNSKVCIFLLFDT